MTDPELKFNDKWIFMDLDSGNVVEAEIIGIYTTDILGEIDSIKEISLNVRQDGQLVPNKINGTSIKISSKNGIIQLPSFYDFPLDQGIYELSGYKGNPNGIKLMTFRDAFDWAVGDELQFSSFSGFWNDNYHKINILSTYKILEKNEGIGYFQYLIDREVQSETYTKGVPSYTHTFDILDTTINYKVHDDALPDEPVRYYELSDWECDSRVSYTYYINEYFDNRQAIQVNEPILCETKDDCWQQAVFIDNYDYPTHIFGFGFQRSSDNNFYNDSQSIIYFKRGNKIWGSKEVIVGLDEEVEITSGVITYNPANKTITIPNIENSNWNMFRLFSIQGVEVIDKADINQGTSIPLNNLSPGLYFYNLISADKSLTGKIFISK